MPRGREANLIHDGPAAAFAVANWPAPIVFSGFEIGQDIMTGAGLREARQGTPVRRAYELYNGLNHRQSRDQTAVLYAVRRLAGGLAGYWDIERKGHLHVHQDGSNEWRNAPDKDHACLVRKMDPAKVAAVIEALMLRRPGRRRGRRQTRGAADLRRPPACNSPHSLTKRIIDFDTWSRTLLHSARCRSPLGVS